MSYARSPRPSLVITVGIICTWLPPWLEADGWTGFWRRGGHRHVRAEVGHASQRVHVQAGVREPELDRRIFGPGGSLRVGAEKAGEVGVDVGGPGAQRVRHRQEQF